MATPYCTTAMLLSAPAGLSWQVVPTLNADTDAQLAQLDQVCWKATSDVDTYCRQPLRATISTETSTGPGSSRISVDRGTGRGVVITRYWPVTSVAAVLVSPAQAFPETWNPVPPGQYRPRHPASISAGPVPVTSPSGGNRIDVAHGHIDWRYGRAGWQVQTSYQHGWPHTSLTAPALAGATQISVDDVTGWNTVTGFCYDGPATEQVYAATAAATQPVSLPNNAGTVHAGPGTITLAQPLTSPHPVGAVVSALPAAVIQAAALYAVIQALETIDAITTISQIGQLAGGTAVLATEVEMLLDDYRRVA